MSHTIRRVEFQSRVRCSPPGSLDWRSETHNPNPMFPTRRDSKHLSAQTQIASHSEDAQCSPGVRSADYPLPSPDNPRPAAHRTNAIPESLLPQSPAHVAYSWSRFNDFRRAPFSVYASPATPPSMPADAPHCNKRIRAPPSLPDHTDSAHPARSDTLPACADAPDPAPRTLPTPSESAARPRPSPPRTHPMPTRRPISALLGRVPSPLDRKRKCGSPRAAVPVPAASPAIPEYRRYRP